MTQAPDAETGLAAGDATGGEQISEVAPPAAGLKAQLLATGSAVFARLAVGAALALGVPAFEAGVDASFTESTLAAE